MAWLREKQWLALGIYCCSSPHQASLTFEQAGWIYILLLDRWLCSVCGALDLDGVCSSLLLTRGGHIATWPMFPSATLPCHRTFKPAVTKRRPGCLLRVFAIQIAGVESKVCLATWGRVLRVPHETKSGMGAYVFVRCCRPRDSYLVFFTDPEDASCVLHRWPP